MTRIKDHLRTYKNYGGKRYIKEATYTTKKEAEAHLKKSKKNKKVLGRIHSESKTHGKKVYRVYTKPKK